MADHIGKKLSHNSSHRSPLFHLRNFIGGQDRKFADKQVRFTDQNKNTKPRKIS